MDLVIDSICDFFDVQKEAIIRKDNSHKISITRNYIYYILHYDFNFSIGKIAKRFNRCRREISYRVSETKYRIEYIKEFKNQYQQINDFMYKNKG